MGSKKIYKAGELADYVGGKLIGNSDRKIKMASGVEESSSDTVTFAEDIDKFRQACQAGAGLVVVSEKYSDNKKQDILLVSDSRLAYARIAGLFASDPYYKPGIHPGAVISDSAKLGNGVSIHPRVVVAEDVEVGDNVILGPGVYVGCGVKIGSNTILHPLVVVEYGSIIGSNVIIHSGSVIGADGFGYVSDENGHHKIPQLGNVVIEDEVEIGANSAVDRAASGSTIIGRGSKIDNLVQIGHNVKIGEEVLIVGQVGVAGSSTVGDRVILAGNAGVSDHVKIGANSVITAKSLVTKDVPGGVMYSGNPAHAHRDELKEQAFRRRLPDLVSRIKKLEQKINELEGEETN